MVLNKQAVLEHIAEATQRNISDVEKAVSVEYWKGIVDFTSLEGVDLFADYLKSQGIKKILGTETRLSVKIPISRFQEAITSGDVASFCIDSICAGRFKKQYENEFNFVV